MTTSIGSRILNSMTKFSSRFRSVLTICVGLIMITGCTKVPFHENQHQSDQADRINLLEKRIKQLERRLGQQESSPSEIDGNAPRGPIKSLTFRMGSSDDRLRIYWADGSSSDLPCTQEQSILACG